MARFDSQSFPGEDIDQSQCTKTATTLQLIADEVHAPVLVRRGWSGSWRLAMCGADMATWPFGPQLQVFFAVQPVHAFVIDGPAFTAQQHVGPLVAVAYPRLGDLTAPPLQHVLRWPLGLIPDH